ncbi:tyrosine-specific protein phosphatase family protein [Zopfochytrium polystomum]|nr:tyrosine-specific protein phosphatase family protein [Zopfochytrium polystomum]
MNECCLVGNVGNNIRDFVLVCVAVQSIHPPILQGAVSPTKDTNSNSDTNRSPLSLHSTPPQPPSSPHPICPSSNPICISLLRDHDPKMALSLLPNHADDALPSKVVPPLNFAMVATGVYRSGYPNKKNFPFLLSLRLNTIMYVCADDIGEDNVRFCGENGIRLIHYRIQGNKEPFMEIDQTVMASALADVLDVRNHPILIHCNKGKHRVGCLVGCLRKLQDWSLTSIFDEYQRFSGAKIRIADQEFIEVFDAPIECARGHLPKWLSPVQLAGR